MQQVVDPKSAEGKTNAGSIGGALPPEVFRLRNPRSGNGPRRALFRFFSYGVANHQVLVSAISTIASLDTFAM